MFKEIVYWGAQKVLRPATKKIDDVLFLQGRIAAAGLRSLNELPQLSDAEFRVFSQRGEDGILEWLIQRLPITSSRFIEFGVGEYHEANTRFLMMNRNWKGLVIDSHPGLLRSVRNNFLGADFDLTAQRAFITRENINELFVNAGFRGEIGVLNIDIDGNDYWVWQAINVVHPVIVVCEYNAVFGDIHPLSIPYEARFCRSASKGAGLYWGVSIAALIKLGEEKGYTFVGTTLHGNDAFFVRNDVAPLVSASIVCKDPHPSRVRESRDATERLTYLAGTERLRAIEDLPVVRLDSGETVAIKTIGPLYSDKWLSAM